MLLCVLYNVCVKPSKNLSAFTFIFISINDVNDDRIINLWGSYLNTKKGNNIMRFQF